MQKVGTLRVYLDTAVTGYVGLDTLLQGSVPCRGTIQGVNVRVIVIVVGIVVIVIVVLVIVVAVVIVIVVIR